MEFTEEVPGVTHIILVNDSHKGIEAFHLSQRCEAGGSFDSRDALDGPFTIFGGTHGPDESKRGTIGVEPGGRWDAGPLSKSGDHECEPQIDALIFSDGSYEGKEAIVQGLKARRDGIVASVDYWSEKVNQVHPDEADLGSLLAVANRRGSTDHMKMEQNPIKVLEDEVVPLLHQYWEGRYQVDECLATQFSKRPSEIKNGNTFQHLKEIIVGWKQVVDRDVSMKMLNARFPPISVSAGDL